MMVLTRNFLKIVKKSLMKTKEELEQAVGGARGIVKDTPDDRGKLDLTKIIEDQNSQISKMGQLCRVAGTAIIDLEKDLSLAKKEIYQLKEELKLVKSKKGGEMLIYGNTPEDLKQKLYNNKSYLIVFIVGFIFGLLI